MVNTITDECRYVSYLTHRVPPNCHFELDDIEQSWTWKDDTADLVYSRDLILAIRDWPKLIEQSYRYAITLQLSR